MAGIVEPEPNRPTFDKPRIVRKGNIKLNKKTIHFSELLYIFSFLLYLFASSLTLIQHGIELSLWLMTFAVLFSGIPTIFPWIGITWLKLEQKGSRTGYWIALAIQFISWGTFVYAMFLRLNRELEIFYNWITATTLLYATWLIIFILSRYAFQTHRSDDKLME
jgi:hypothetical protein